MEQCDSEEAYESACQSPGGRAGSINEAKAVEQGAIPPVPPPDEKETTELKKEVAGYKAKLRIAENALVTIDKAAEQKLSAQGISTGGQ